MTGSENTSSLWRSYLRDDLKNRQAKNPEFSLRSYAKHLKLSPTQLSLIMSGKRSVTPKVAIHLGQHLGVTSAETITWLKPKQDFVDGRSKKSKILSSEEFHPISEWYYFGILALARLKTNSADPAWIARRLNLPLQIAAHAFKQLVKTNYIVLKDGQFRRLSADARTKADAPSQTVRKFHRQVLQIASNKLEQVPVEKREFNHMSLAIDPKNIESAKKKLREFMEEFTEEYTQGNKTSVYHLNINFYPISEEK
jgi:uncharacterized protein (TIGR02147 family)